jgi:hypothetical protein
VPESIVVPLAMAEKRVADPTLQNNLDSQSRVVWDLSGYRLVSFDEVGVQ